MQQADLMKDKNDVELGNAKMELQRQFIEVENKRAIELDQLRGTEDDSRRRLAAEAAVWEGEKIDLQHKMRELNRKLEEQQDDLRVLQQQNVELKGDRTRLNEDIERV
jgi:chromosome segregation ATPase